ncbi:hypothetical protein [Solimonas sp. SE-A11]|nr:hypothetical protein [Solimonas sp. SE-A11]MDM4773005.1 hypothetical protein [Solimonas sp. SE-A11]
MTAYKALVAEQVALLKQRPPGEMLHLIALFEMTDDTCSLARRA